jgi:cell division protein FtsZ
MAPAESLLTELAGRLRNVSRQVARRIERIEPSPQLESLPALPAARLPNGGSANPNSEYTRHAAPRGLDPYGRASPAQNFNDDVLDIPAFLRRWAS